MPIPSLASSLKPQFQGDKFKETLKYAEPSARLPQRELSPDTDPPRGNRSPTRLPLPSNTSQPQDDGVKRKSHLPQRGEQTITGSRRGLDDSTTRYGSVQQAFKSRNEGPASSASGIIPQKVSTVTGGQSRPRPMSLYQKSSTGAESQGGGNGKTNTQVSKLPDSSRNTATVPHAGLSRSQSLRRPGQTSGMSQTSTTRIHSRNLSTNTMSNSQRYQTDSNQQLQRPKTSSMQLSSAKTSQINGQPVLDSDASNRSSQRIAALKRSTNNRPRPERLDSPDSTGTTDSDQPAVSNTGRRREPIKDEMRKQTRPAFSTLQQHFTPKKTSKAPTSAFIHPPAPDPATNTMSSEILALQTELLQLHLLHEASAQTSCQWERSAKRALHGKFDEVASLYQVMRDNERQVQEQINLRALQEWTSGNSSFGLAENIQLLSAPLHELPALADAGGRFARLVEDFERWIAWVEEIWAAREQDYKGLGRELKSAEGLGDSWKAENAALTRKLTTFTRDMESLTEPSPGSSIASIVSRCRTLLGGMLDELRIMQSIETGVVERERQWIEEGLREIALDIGAHLQKTQEGTELWRK